MARYFEQQIAEAARMRAVLAPPRFFRASNLEQSADAYRKDWAHYLAVPGPAGAPLHVKRINVREFDG